jgi:hypothetical protein
MGIRPSLLELPRNRTDGAGRPWRYPPTFFVGMARDTAMADWINLDAEKLKSQVRAPDQATLPQLRISTDASMQQRTCGWLRCMLVTATPNQPTICSAQFRHPGRRTT